MLEEHEWRTFAEELKLADERTPRGNLALERENDTHWRARFAAALAEYNRLTGLGETNINAAMHHRVALYGAPCARCGKPFRTPRAAFCAACGYRNNVVRPT